MSKVLKKPIQKIRVFANLAISLDGRIADAKRPSQMLGTSFDRRLMQKIRAESDVVVMGAETVRVIRKAIDVKNKKGRRIANAVVSLSGEMDSGLAFWKDSKIVKFLFTTKKNYLKAVESAQDRAFVVATGTENLAAGQIIEALQAAGFKNILLEGGGKLIGLFLKEGLIDDIYLTLTPWMIGGVSNPSLVSTLDALSPWGKLKLLSHKKKGNEIFLHYRFLRS